MLDGFDRMTAETLVSRLDQKTISAREAKDHAARVLKVTLTGRTREQLARELCKLMRRA